MTFEVSIWSTQGHERIQRVKAGKPWKAVHKAMRQTESFRKRTVYSITVKRVV